MPVFPLVGLTDKPRYDQLPKISTGSARRDSFLNEYFMRHLSIDDHGVYWDTGPVPGTTCWAWVLQWDTLTQAPVDRSAMGFRRWQGITEDAILRHLGMLPVDRFGYTWGGPVRVEATDQWAGSIQPHLGWPWPFYVHNREAKTAVAWEFNHKPGEQSAERDSWSAEGITLEPNCVDYSLAGTVVAEDSKFVSPPMITPAFQTPFLDVDITFKSDDPNLDASQMINRTRIYWTTNKQPNWNEENSVDASFALMPPSQLPDYFMPSISPVYARYLLFLPMYMHPGWGKSDDTIITGLKIAPGSRAKGARVLLDHVRTAYDNRCIDTNATLINGTADMLLWQYNKEFLTFQLPRLRKAWTFLKVHMQIDKYGVPCTDFMVGKDGLGNKSGHGVLGSYWDLYPCGRFCLESTIGAMQAASKLAILEDMAAAEGIQVPPESVDGPDGVTKVTYHETAASLRATAKRIKKTAEKIFWIPEKGRFGRNIDVNGKLIDYGFLHFNLWALAVGIGTAAQRRSVLSWLDGRVIPGDTAVGADIYKWRFAPRTTTKRNNDWYYWPWQELMDQDPNSPQFTWGNQMQDGGAVPFTSLFELMNRAEDGTKQQQQRSAQRMNDIMLWFDDVKSAGGDGSYFYRKYYDGHPERGRQQGGGPAGGLGLDREFMGDSASGTMVPFWALMGLKPLKHKELTVRPFLPEGWPYLEITNLYWQQNHITLRADNNSVTIGGELSKAKGLSLRVVFRNTPRDVIIEFNGRQVPFTRSSDGITCRIPLRAGRLAWRAI